MLNQDGNTGRFAYYGFSNAIERDFFEALLSVASIGPRSAARAFSQPMSAIAGAIERADQTFLKSLPGIGQQKARDIVAKLQGKVAKFLLIQDAPVPVVAAMPDFASEALAVLLQLEYKRAEAEAMVRDTLEARTGDRRLRASARGDIPPQSVEGIRQWMRARASVCWGRRRRSTSPPRRTHRRSARHPRRRSLRRQPAPAHVRRVRRPGDGGR